MKRALKIEVPADEVTQQFSFVPIWNSTVKFIFPVFDPGKPLSALFKSDTLRRSKKMSFEISFLISMVKPSNKPGSVRVVVDIPPSGSCQNQKRSRIYFHGDRRNQTHDQFRDYKVPESYFAQADKRTVAEEQVDRALEVLREQHGSAGCGYSG